MYKGGITQSWNVKENVKEGKQISNSNKYNALEDREDMKEVPI